LKKKERKVCLGAKKKHLIKKKSKGTEKKRKAKEKK